MTGFLPLPPGFGSFISTNAGGGAAIRLDRTANPISRRSEQAWGTLSIGDRTNSSAEATAWPAKRISDCGGLISDSKSDRERSTASLSTGLRAMQVTKRRAMTRRIGFGIEARTRNAGAFEGRYYFRRFAKAVI